MATIVPSIIAVRVIVNMLACAAHAYLCEVCACVQVCCMHVCVCVRVRGATSIVTYQHVRVLNVSVESICIVQCTYAASDPGMTPPFLSKINRSSIYPAWVRMRSSIRPIMVGSRISRRLKLANQSRKNAVWLPQAPFQNIRELYSVFYCVRQMNVRRWTRQSA